MAKRRFLILGGAGLVGRTMAQELLDHGEQVTIVDLREPTVVVRRGLQYLVRDAISDEELSKLIDQVRPTHIVNTINLATIFSAGRTKGYGEMIDFYAKLYRALSKAGYPLHYIQVGTTGAGGLGFNIPFTHGEDVEDLPIIHKAAFAGITTALLTLISRSFPKSSVQISEIKPGLAIFAGTIQVSSVNGAQLVTLDGGESGAYTYNELALLTHYMGFTTAEKVADKILRLCSGKNGVHKTPRYDIVQNINTTIVGSERADKRLKDKLQRQMKKQQGQRYVIATGSLGPATITRDLLFGYITVQGLAFPEKGFQALQDQDESIKGTLQYLKAEKPDLYRFLINEVQASDYQKFLKDVHSKAEEPWKVVVDGLQRRLHFF